MSVTTSQLTTKNQLGHACMQVQQWRTHTACNATQVAKPADLRADEGDPEGRKLDYVRPVEPLAQVMMAA